MSNKGACQSALTGGGRFSTLKSVLGRLAQWQSIGLTNRGSQVRSLHRPSRNERERVERQKSPGATRRGTFAKYPDKSVSWLSAKRAEGRNPLEQTRRGISAKYLSRVFLRFCVSERRRQKSAGATRRRASAKYLSRDFRQHFRCLIRIAKRAEAAELQRSIPIRILLIIRDSPHRPGR
jgi:hypothetical protein